jgi:hypothetical protein
MRNTCEHGNWDGISLDVLQATTVFCERAHSEGTGNDDDQSARKSDVSRPTEVDSENNSRLYWAPIVDELQRQANNTDKQHRQTTPTNNTDGWFRLQTALERYRETPSMTPEW